jgi:hypothetical protein
MKKMINFLTLLILITILSIITIFITSCNSSSDNNIIGIIGGSGGSGGSGGGNVITLSLNNTGTPGTPVSQANNVNNTAISEFANGLLDPNTNSLFILGNDFPAGGNPNVYLFRFTPPNTFNSSTIDFTSGTNGQGGNLYIDQDTNNIYAMGSHNNGTDSDIFVAKIDKNNLNFVSGFGNGNPAQGVVLLDRGNSESTGGLLVDGTNLYVAGYNNQGKIIIFKLNTTNGSLVSGFGSGGYTEIDVDNNNNTIDIATDILTDGTNLIIVGEQQINPATFKLMLFKVDPNTGNVVPGSLITINPPSGASLVASALDAVILNNKVYLGALLLDPNSFALNNSALAVFDLNNNTASYFIFKDSSNNDIKIFITDVYYPGTGNIIYLSGTDTTNNNNNAAFIKFDTSNNSGSYLIANSTAGSWWGNVFYNNFLYIFGRLNSSPSSFTVLPIQNP